MIQTKLKQGLIIVGCFALVALSFPSAAHAGANETKVMGLIMSELQGANTNVAQDSDVNFSVSYSGSNKENTVVKKSLGANLWTTLKSQYRPAQQIVSMNGNIIVSGSSNGFTFSKSLPFNIILEKDTYLYIFINQQYVDLAQLGGSHELDQYANKWIRGDLTSLKSQRNANKKGLSAYISGDIERLWSNPNWFTAKLKSKTAAGNVYEVKLVPGTIIQNLKATEKSLGLKPSSDPKGDEAAINKIAKDLKLTITEKNNKIIGTNLSFTASNTDTETKTVYGVKTAYTKTDTVSVLFNDKTTYLTQASPIIGVPVQYVDVVLYDVLEKVFNPAPKTNTNVQTNTQNNNQVPVTGGSLINSAAELDRLGFSYSIPSGYTLTQEGSSLDANLNLLGNGSVEFDDYLNRLNVYIYSDTDVNSTIQKSINETEALKAFTALFSRDEKVSKVYFRTYNGNSYVMAETYLPARSSSDYREYRLDTVRAYMLKNGLVYEITLSDDFASFGRNKDMIGPFLGSVRIGNTK